MRPKSLVDAMTADAQKLSIDTEIRSSTARLLQPTIAAMAPT
jgi:hypothetical protein